jgi:hydrogenase nickel incorporation protein HypA/HybF
MHELSIAEALSEQVQTHLPVAHRLTSLRLRIGAKQGIDGDSLRWSWEMVVRGTAMEGSRMELEMLPWDLSCPECGRTWQSPELLVACNCGCATPVADGSSDLMLLSLEVEPAEGRTS